MLDPDGSNQMSIKTAAVVNSALDPDETSQKNKIVDKGVKKENFQNTVEVDPGEVLNLARKNNLLLDHDAGPGTLNKVSESFGPKIWKQTLVHLRINKRSAETWILKKKHGQVLSIPIKPPIRW